MLREAAYKKQEIDAKLAEVSMNDKGRWGGFKEKQKRAKAELSGKRACVAYLLPDVNDAFEADLEGGLTIGANQMRKEQERMKPVLDTLTREGREDFEDQRYAQSWRNALIKEKTYDPFGVDIKTGDDVQFLDEFDNDSIEGKY